MFAVLSYFSSGSEERSNEGDIVCKKWQNATFSPFRQTSSRVRRWLSAQPTINILSPEVRVLGWNANHLSYDRVESGRPASRPGSCPWLFLIAPRNLRDLRGYELRPSVAPMLSSRRREEKHMIAGVPFLCSLLLLFRELWPRNWDSGGTERSPRATDRSVVIWWNWDSLRFMVDISD